VVLCGWRAAGSDETCVRGMESRRGNLKPKEKVMEHDIQQERQQELQLEIEELEERIAPSVPPGLLGFEGQPGNQGGH
jgi:hypothetical protein